jgi:hypothetical protein
MMTKTALAIARICRSCLKEVSGAMNTSTIYAQLEMLRWGLMRVKTCAWFVENSTELSWQTKRRLISKATFVRLRRPQFGVILMQMATVPLMAF